MDLHRRMVSLLFGPDRQLEHGDKLGGVEEDGLRPLGRLGAVDDVAKAMAGWVRWTW